MGGPRQSTFADLSGKTCEQQQHMTIIEAVSSSGRGLLIVAIAVRLVGLQFPKKNR